MTLTLFGGLILANNFCTKQTTYELQQACFEDAFWLPIQGLIISVATILMIDYKLRQFKIEESQC